MSKYLLCIILGIILFLLWNNKNGFSVGSLNIGDPCDNTNPDSCTEERDGANICQDKCICSNVGTDDEPKHICQLKYDSDEGSSCAVGGGAAGGAAGEAINVYDIDELEVYMINNNTMGNIPNHCKDAGPGGTRDFVPQQINTACSRYCINYPSASNNCSFTNSNRPYRLGVLRCNFNASFKQDSVEDSYSEWGYKKVNRLVDVNNTTGVFQQYIDILNTNKASVLTSNMIVSNLSFSEYLLKQYIENNEEKYIKMISRGIFYCNGKLFYFHTVNAVVRLALPKEVIRSRRKDPMVVFNFMTENDDNKRSVNRYNFLQHKGLQFPSGIPSIHVDFPVDKLSQDKSGLTPEAYVSFMEEYSTNPDLKTRIDIEGEGQENARIDCIDHLNLSESEQFFTNNAVTKIVPFGGNLVTFASEKYGNEQELRDAPYLSTLTVPDLPDSFQEMELDFVQNEGVDVFNMWLLLVKPKNEKTLAFFRTSQDNDNMKRLTRIDENPDKLSTYDADGDFSPFMSASYTAYSFKMEEGDAFRFNLEYTPHFGSLPEKKIRLGIDTRYSYLESEFGLEQVFKIDSDNNLVVRTEVGNTTPLVIPPYLPLVIYKWFQDQFDLIKGIYDEFKSDQTDPDQRTIHDSILRHENNGRFSVTIFQMVLDNVHFHRYVNDDLRSSFIRIFLTRGL